MRTFKVNHSQASGLQDFVPDHSVQVVSIVSGKGGVGKTNVSTNLALTLINEGLDVLLMDADLGLANIDVLLGLQPKFNLSHVLRGEKTLDEIILNGPSGLRIIPASSGIGNMSDLSPAEHIGLVRAFSGLRDIPDVLLIDAAAGISDSVVTLSKASNEVLVVVCDEPASITDAYALIKLLNREHQVQKFRILANSVRSTQEGVDLFKKLFKVADHYLDVTLDYMGAVPHDECLRKAVQRQRAVVDVYPRSKSALAFEKLAQKAKNWPTPRMAKGHIEFFIDRVCRLDSRSNNAI